MKKRLFSIALTATLVLTTVFAGTEAIFANTITQLQGSNNKIAAKAVEAETIIAENMNSGKTAQTYAMHFDKSEAQYVPIKIPAAGSIEIDLAAISNQYGSNVKVKAEPTATSSTIASAYISSSSSTKSLFVQAKKATTYYLEFTTTTSGSYQINYAVYYAPAGGTPVKGKTYIGSSPNGSVSYYKVTAPGNGYLNLKFTKSPTSYPSYRVKLTSSKKKSLFRDYEYISSSKNFQTFIGVAKGTYYIAVKTTDAAYGFDLTYNSVKEYSGTSKSRAKSIYKGGTKKGVVTASQSSSSSDWYKFKITKSQKVKFNIDGLLNGGGSYGGVKVVFYQYGRRTYTATNYLYATSNPLQVTLYTTGRSTLAPGTYYVKVSKQNSGNGQYSIKWL